LVIQCEDERGEVEKSDAGAFEWNFSIWLLQWIVLYCTDPNGNAYLCRIDVRRDTQDITRFDAITDQGVDRITHLKRLGWSRCLGGIRD